MTQEANDHASVPFNGDDDECFASNELSDEGVASTSKTLLLPVHSVPNDEQYFRYSNLFQCSVVVEENKFSMYYEHPDGTETVVLRADKQKTLLRMHPTFHNFDVSNIEGGSVVALDKTDVEYLGTLEREKYLRVQLFALHSERESPPTNMTMQILYESPSMLSVLMKQSPRKAQVAIYHEAKSTAGDLGNSLSDRVMATMEETCFVDSVTHPESGPYKFCSKEPYVNANGECALNFSRRCLLSNSANMQLEDDDGRIIAQVAQVAENKFSVDFRAPFNAIQAFGFDIAQLCDY